MLQKLFQNVEDKEKNIAKIIFVYLFMILVSIVTLNRYVSSVYPIILLAAIELAFFLIKKKIAVNYLFVAWLVNIGIIAVRTVTWDQTNIKLMLSYAIGIGFFVLLMDTPFKLSYIFNKYIKFFIVAIMLILPLVQGLVPSLSIWGEAGSGIVGKGYYVHIMAFIWLAYCFFSTKMGILWKMVTVLLIAVVVMLTGSRSNLLTMPVAIGAVYILEADKGQAIKRLAKLAVLAFVLAVVAYAVGRYFQMDSILRIMETIERILDGRDFSNGRSSLTELAMNDFRSAPIWGIGWMNFSNHHNNYNVHNFYIQLLCEIGIVGIVLFLMPFAYVLISDIRFIRTTTSTIERKSICVSLAYQIYFLLSSALHATSYDSVYILLYFVFMTFSCSIKSQEEVQERAVLKNIKEIVISLFMYAFSFVVNRKKNWYAFGSWRGEQYIDNSRYLYEYIRTKDQECVCIWIGNDKIKKEILQHPNTRVYSKNSFQSMFALLKCKYMFCSQMHSDDLCNYNVYRKAIITYLHHGMPVKKWGADSARGHQNFNASKGLKKLIRILTAKEIRYDYFATSSALHEKTNLSSLDYRGCVAEKNLKSGTPRNDMLVNADKAYIESLREKYARQLGFDPSKKIIMYLPTFRRKGTPTRSFVSGIGEDEYKKIHQVIEKHNAILIEKNHFAEDAKGGDACLVKRDGIIHVDQNVNVQEMLLICDVLISDYSGAFMDFVLLDRPIIHYAYDYEDYKNNDSGLYYEIKDFAAGEVAYDFLALCTCLENSLLDPASGHERRQSVRNQYMTYENGVASQRIYDWVCVK